MAQVERTSILTLPDELLSPILLSAASFRALSSFSSYYRGRGRGYGDVVTLPRVCKRFYRLVIPYLYKDLSILCDPNGAEVEFRQSTLLLHRTLRQDPSLWIHCQKLSIDTVNLYEAPKCNLTDGCAFRNLFYIAQDLIFWLKGTKELWIRGKACCGKSAVPGDISGLVRLAVENLRALETLRLYNKHNVSYDLPSVIGALSGLAPSTCPRTLALCGISKAGTPLDWKMLGAKAGTASFVNLHVKQFLQSAEVLQALVQWSRGLESFSFNSPSSDYFSGDHALSTYSLDVLYRVLSAQKTTLTHLKIHTTYTRGFEGFNLNDFTALQSLWLSHDLTGTDTTHVANLIAPNLRSFDWDMELEDQQCGVQLCGFAQPEEDWLRAFATAAINRQSTLGHIRVHFYPDNYVSSYDKETYQNQYPWDRMEKIAEEILPHGIKLFYNTPTMTRKEFFNQLNDTTDTWEMEDINETPVN